MGDEIDGLGVSGSSSMDITASPGNSASAFSTLDMTDGLVGVSRHESVDEIDAAFVNTGEVVCFGDVIPQRSEIRVKHAQQDTMEGDPLGGALVTYKVDQEYIHHFEEFGLFEKSLLRDSLQVRQNDQLVTLNEWTVNEMDHNTVIKLFLSLEIGTENVMVVANRQISTDTLRQISFSLYGFIKEESEDEEKPREMLRVENFALAALPFGPKIDEVFISPAREEQLYLCAGLRFCSNTETDKSVHYIRKRDTRLVGSNFRITSTFQQKSAGFLAIDENGDVVQIPQFHPNANFKATFNDWGNWYIKSENYGRYLAVQNRRLCSISYDQEGQIAIKPARCRYCI